MTLNGQATNAQFHCRSHILEKYIIAFEQTQKCPIEMLTELHKQNEVHRRALCTFRADIGVTWVHIHLRTMPVVVCRTKLAGVTSTEPVKDTY